MYSAGQKCEGDRCLGRCEGDCDTDDHCEEGLMCWERNKWDPNLPPGNIVLHFQHQNTFVML